MTADTMHHTEQESKGRSEVGQAFTVTCPVNSDHEIPCHTEGYYPESCDACEDETLMASTWSTRQKRYVESQFDAFCNGTEAA